MILSQLVDNSDNPNKPDSPNILDVSYTGGKLQVLFSQLLKSERVDGKDVSEDVERLYAAGEGKIGTDKQVFIDFLTQHSRAYVDQVALAYLRTHEKPLAQAIQSEFSGDLKKALVALCLPPVEYVQNTSKITFQQPHLEAVLAQE